jgi:hypothetical protein
VKILVGTTSGGSTVALLADTDLDQFQASYYPLRDVEEVDCCGIGTGWGPWACPEPVGHREHRCVICGEPGTALCPFAGWMVCGAPTCAAHGCPTHG